MTGWIASRDIARGLHQILVTRDEPKSQWAKGRQSSQESGWPTNANLYGSHRYMDENRLSRLITLPASPIGQHRVHHELALIIEITWR